ncbi:MAG: hypothetical protein R3257_04855 [bacterium]|nr:hypothetical protein [bacterium]
MRTSPYLDRYGLTLTPEPQEQPMMETWDDTSWDALAYDDVFAGGAPDPLAGEGRLGDEELLDTLSGDLPEGDSFMKESLQRDIHQLGEEIAAAEFFSEDPVAQRNFQNKLSDMEMRLANPEEYEALEREFEELQTEFEELREELELVWHHKYGQAKSFTEYLKSQGVQDLSVEDFVAILEREGLSVEDLKLIGIPSTAENYQKIFAILLETDPQLSRLMDINKDNPFQGELKNRIRQDLSQLFPEFPRLDDVQLESFIITTVELDWPNVSELTGQLGKDHGASYNSLNSNAERVIGLWDEAIRTGDFSRLQSESITNIQSDGLNWDRGNAGNCHRRVLGAIFGAAGEDMTLFRAWLKQHVPTEVIRDLQFLFQDGGHNLSQEGDLLTTDQIRAVLQEVLEMP